MILEYFLFYNTTLRLLFQFQYSSYTKTVRTQQQIFEQNGLNCDFTKQNAVGCTTKVAWLIIQSSLYVGRLDTSVETLDETYSC